MDIEIGRSGETSSQDFDQVLLGSGKLKISFHRTIRVTDSNDVSDMPPDLGRFPILPINGFNKVPGEVVKMGGIMIPMYRELLNPFR